VCHEAKSNVDEDESNATTAAATTAAAIAIAASDANNSLFFPLRQSVSHRHSAVSLTTFKL